MAAVFACGGMLAGLDPCIPNDFLFNLATQTRDSLALNLTQVVIDGVTEALFPGLDTGTGDGTGDP